MTSATTYNQYCVKHDLVHPDESTCAMCKQDTIINKLQKQNTALLAAGNAMAEAMTTNGLGEQAWWKKARAALFAWEQVTK